MLNEVRNTIILFRLETRANVQVDTNRGGGSVPVFRGDAKAVVKGCNFSLGKTDFVSVAQRNSSLESTEEGLKEDSR